MVLEEPGPMMLQNTCSILALHVVQQTQQAESPTKDLFYDAVPNYTHPSEISIATLLIEKYLINLFPKRIREKA
jgi:hypothetical protein